VAFPRAHVSCHFTFDNLPLCLFKLDHHRRSNRDANLRFVQAHSRTRLIGGLIRVADKRARKISADDPLLPDYRRERLTDDRGFC
jgi:hypothetical protein